MKNKKKISRDFFWNTAGSLIYALMSMILAFFVMRTQGAEDGGIFGFGFSTFGQQMFIIAYFGIRPFQITDVRREYSFRTYRYFRFLTSGAAAGIAALWLLWLSASGQYTPYKALIVWLLAAYKILDGWADVYESEFQRDGKLYRAGQLLCLRTAVCGGALMLALLLHSGLLGAVVTAVCLQLLFMGIYRMAGRRELPEGNGGGSTGKLFRSTVLLFFSVFLDFYVFSAAKYAVDLHLTDADNGIFNLLFMPTNIIYLAANFIIKPFMTYLAAAYETRDLERFSGIVRKIGGLIGALTLVCCLGALLLGGLVLRIGELVLGAGYTGMLTQHRMAFTVIILGGGVYALANLYYYVLVILRRQSAVFWIYAAASVCAAVLAPILVGKYAVSGAAFCYLILMLALCIGFYALGRGYLRKEQEHA